MHNERTLLDKQMYEMVLQVVVVVLFVFVFVFVVVVVVVVLFVVTAILPLRRIVKRHFKSALSIAQMKLHSRSGNQRLRNIKIVAEHSN